MPIDISQQATDALAAANGGKVVEPCPKAASSKPVVATEHILDGEINPHGKAVGFHHRPGGSDPPTSHLDQVTGGPNASGIYVGKVQVFDPAKNIWVQKKAKSSFYPDNMSPAEIEQAIQTSYEDAVAKGEVLPNGKFEGESGKGFSIGGYAKDGKIATAYPIFEED